MGRIEDALHEREVSLFAAHESSLDHHQLKLGRFWFHDITRYYIYEYPIEKSESEQSGGIRKSELIRIGESVKTAIAFSQSILPLSAKRQAIHEFYFIIYLIEFVFVREGETEVGY